MSDCKLMMATKATHNLGDLSRDEPHFCAVREDPDDCDHYIGNWISGFGFINVKFPKSTTRACTPEEEAFFNDITSSFKIGSLSEFLASRESKIV